MKTWVVRSSATFGVLLTIAAVIWYHDWQHWLAYATGAYNCPKTGCPGGVAHNYNFFSGAGSDVAEVTIPVSVLGLIGTMLRRNNCEVHGCWRLGRHDTAAGHTVCRHHHPEGAPSAADVVTAHEEAKAAAC